jgi:hypothetical protein
MVFPGQLRPALPFLHAVLYHVGICGLIRLARRFLVSRKEQFYEGLQPTTNAFHEKIRTGSLPVLNREIHITKKYIEGILTYVL